MKKDALNFSISRKSVIFAVDKTRQSKTKHIMKSKRIIDMNRCGIMIALSFFTGVVIACIGSAEMGWVLCGVSLLLMFGPIYLAGGYGKEAGESEEDMSQETSGVSESSDEDIFIF